MPSLVTAPKYCLRKRFVFLVVFFLTMARVHADTEPVMAWRFALLAGCV
jgi:hypothetical protein